MVEGGGATRWGPLRPFELLFRRFLRFCDTRTLDLSEAQFEALVAHYGACHEEASSAFFHAFRQARSCPDEEARLDFRAFAEGICVASGGLPLAATGKYMFEFFRRAPRQHFRLTAALLEGRWGGLRAAFLVAHRGGGDEFNALHALYTHGACLFRMVVAFL
mmetsp:Transcript_105283/g.295024  ORF Transcript_105283/g.295024 Transcript_105283/m.295024 type:complete len:162 (-) Transcript_105283:2-487(-)